MDMACDPSLVYHQGFYYLYYSSAMTTAPNVFQTIVRVARSVNIDGPYLTFTESHVGIHASRAAHIPEL